MLKEKIKNKINHHQKLFKVIFTLFFVIPALITYFIEPIYAVYSFVLYLYLFTCLYVENKTIKGIITVLFIIWLFVFIPLNSGYESFTFNGIVVYILKIIFPIINIILYVFGINP